MEILKLYIMYNMYTFFGSAILRKFILALISNDFLRIAGPKNV